MRLLHTSDWHLGRTLYGRKRYREFESFLEWLSKIIESHRVDALVVAGDLFDTTTPGNRAQELYYRFLGRVAASPCRHVVLIAGNHDSPSFLEAPRKLLSALDVHVVGGVSQDLSDEVLILNDNQGVPELIVCAVPYLRDRDIRTVEAGESFEDKEKKMIEGIRAHYSAVASLAEEKRAAIERDLPIIAMGHLFTAGGQTIDGDGVSRLYVGSLVHVNADIFPPALDYLALGHLHLSQKVNNLEHVRYSGSPLPLGFGQAGRSKAVNLVDFVEGRASVQLIDVPVFQQLARVKGDLDSILRRIAELADIDSEAWLEVVYEGDEVIGDLRDRLDEAVKDTRLEILRVRNNRIIDRVLERIKDQEELEELNLEEVFERCLAAHEVPLEQRSELTRTYRETIASLQEEDFLAG